MTVRLCADEGFSYAAVNRVGKIDRGGTHRQFFYFTFRSKHKNRIAQKFAFDFVKKFAVIQMVFSQFF